MHALLDLQQAAPPGSEGRVAHVSAPTATKYSDARKTWMVPQS
jgi:hypothetical protein